MANRPTNHRTDVNRSAILGLLGTRGPTSRADVARALDVSPASVTQLTKDLIARGLVVELEHAPVAGRSPRPAARPRPVGRRRDRRQGHRRPRRHRRRRPRRHRPLAPPPHPFDPDAPTPSTRSGTSSARRSTTTPVTCSASASASPGSVDSQASGHRRGADPRLVRRARRAVAARRRSASRCSSRTTSTPSPSPSGCTARAASTAPTSS